MVNGHKQNLRQFLKRANQRKDDVSYHGVKSCPGKTRAFVNISEYHPRKRGSKWKVEFSFAIHIYIYIFYPCHIKPAKGIKTAELNLVPRVLSYQVGENPGNEVEQSSEIYRRRSEL